MKIEVVLNCSKDIRILNILTLKVTYFETSYYRTMEKMTGITWSLL